jgi:hypothetical protein
MAKFYGVIGYIEEVETKPGVWTPKVTERNYFGDVLRDSSGWSVQSDSTNDDLTINNQISVVADPFAYQNVRFMKYVVFMGTKWKIKNVEIKYPRVVLSIGGVYNG